MYKILMMIQVIIMKTLAKCKFGGETMIRQFAKFSLPPKLVVVRYHASILYNFIILLFGVHNNSRWVFLLRNPQTNYFYDTYYYAQFFASIIILC